MISKNRMYKTAVSLLVGLTMGVLLCSLLSNIYTKKKIVKYLGQQYGISYSNIDILERAGMATLFSASEAGAVSFKVSGQARINASDGKCENYYFHLKDLLPESTISSESMAEWYCAHHSVSTFHSYTFLYDPKISVYFLFIQTSLG